ncbi:hypothetical protein [Emticicia sp. BO119]|uniref:hypothetical protein n=1 Tax=Emticicia sp. BO119 TaxID=2757768 RepID=UPI0015F023AF|nr:hypothetical protein [Emticicia sp. BO119]MBA4850134.1 hypothetical protein [Emticicia sp. BO119]
MKNVERKSVFKTYHSGKLTMMDASSIPAQVFLNHFEAIHRNIDMENEMNQITSLLFWKKFKPFMNNNRVDYIKTMLLNAWNTEFALRNVVKNSDTRFLNHSLHWTFPQAYFSIFYSIRALMGTQGIYTADESTLSKRMANWIERGFYPSSLGYYSSGNYNDFKIHRLPKATIQPSVDYLKDDEDIVSHIAQFLKTTRGMKAKKLREEIQSNEDTALKNKKNGDPILKFSKQDWAKITSQLPVTTVFDLISRLKYSESNREIERYLNANIAFDAFHNSLTGIVYNVNLVHETYLVKALGMEAYQYLLNEMPIYLQDGFAYERFNNIIKPQMLIKPVYNKKPLAA